MPVLGLSAARSGALDLFKEFLRQLRPSGVAELGCYSRNASVGFTVNARHAGSSSELPSFLPALLGMEGVEKSRYGAG